MKNIYWLIAIPVVYSGIMIYKTPTIADGLIVLGLCCVALVTQYTKLRYDSYEKVTPEVKKLEEELKIEQMKLTIENLKERATRERALKDARASMGMEPDKSIRF